MKKITLSFQALSVKRVLSLVWHIWVRFFRYVFLCVAMIAVYVVLLVWYQNVYKLDQFGPEREQEIEVRKKAVEFEEDTFMRISEKINARREASTDVMRSERDPFFPTIQASREEVISDPALVVSTEDLAIDSLEQSPQEDESVEGILQEDAVSTSDKSDDLTDVPDSSEPPAQADNL